MVGHRISAGHASGPAIRGRPHPTLAETVTENVIRPVVSTASWLILTHGASFPVFALGLPHSNFAPEVEGPRSRC